MQAIYCFSCHQAVKVGSHYRFVAIQANVAPTIPTSLQNFNPALFLPLLLSCALFPEWITFTVSFQFTLNGSQPFSLTIHSMVLTS